MGAQLITYIFLRRDAAGVVLSCSACDKSMTHQCPTVNLNKSLTYTINLFTAQGFTTYFTEQGTSLNTHPATL